MDHADAGEHEQQEGQHQKDQMQGSSHSDTSNQAIENDLEEDRPQFRRRIMNAVASAIEPLEIPWPAFELVILERVDNRAHPGTGMRSRKILSCWFLGNDVAFVRRDDRAFGVVLERNEPAHIERFDGRAVARSDELTAAEQPDFGF
jgi:hypothetical protein